VGFEWIRDVSLQRRGLSPRLRFVLTSGAEVKFTTYGRDQPERFVQALKGALEARARAYPVTSAPHPVPVIPPPPPQ
jgi:hypothetical protein